MVLLKIQAQSLLVQAVTGSAEKLHSEEGKRERGKGNLKRHMSAWIYEGMKPEVSHNLKVTGK
jgi:hypothetical protein